MSHVNGQDISIALSRIPCSAFILTSAFEDHRAGVLVRWVQQCCTAPPMLMIAISKGQRIEPIIRDSRCFALCQISADDRTLQRRFAQPAPASDDPFITLSTRVTPSGSPIIDQAISFIDCQLVRHVELDADHRIYVGQVITASLLRPSPPAVYYGPTGLSA